MLLYDFYDNNIYYDRRIVSKDEKFGFIDKMYNEVIPPVYDDVNSFYYGTSMVVKDKKVGVIDKDGNSIIPLIYDKMLQLTPNIFIVKKDGMFILIDIGNKQLIPEFYDEISADFLGRIIVKKNGKYGLINLQGKTLIPLIYDEIPEKLGQDLYLVKLNGFFGAVDINNKIILEPIYERINKSFSSHLFIRKDNKWGAYSIDDSTFIETKYYDISTIYDNFFLVHDFNGKKGIIDITGKIIIPIEYDYLEVYLDKEEGIETYIAEKNNKYGLLDTKGNIIADFIYDSLSIFLHSAGALLYFSNGSYGLINHVGKELTNAIYDKIDYISFSDNLCVVNIGDKSGCIDATNGTVILPVEFDAIKAYYGYLKVKKNNKFGIYSLNNKHLSKIIYDHLTVHDCGRGISVSIGNRNGYLPISEL